MSHNRNINLSLQHIETVSNPVIALWPFETSRDDVPCNLYVYYNKTSMLFSATVRSSTLDDQVHCEITKLLGLPTELGGGA